MSRASRWSEDLRTSGDTILQLFHLRCPQLTNLLLTNCAPEIRNQPWAKLRDLRHLEIEKSWVEGADLESFLKPGNEVLESLRFWGVHMVPGLWHEIFELLSSGFDKLVRFDAAWCGGYEADFVGALGEGFLAPVYRIGRMQTTEATRGLRSLKVLLRKVGANRRAAGLWIHPSFSAWEQDPENSPQTEESESGRVGEACSLPPWHGASRTHVAESWL